MSLKYAFEYNPNASAFAPAPGGPSLGELMNEIKNDPSISMGQQLALIAQLNSATGALPRSTPLGVIGSAVLGSVLTNLIAKYFGMGIIGRTVTSAVGFGLGSSIYNQVHSNGIPGWTSI